jgi:hypothetical protein
LGIELGIEALPPPSPQKTYVQVAVPAGSPLVVDAALHAAASERAGFGEAWWASAGGGSLVPWAHSQAVLPPCTAAAAGAVGGSTEGAPAGQPSTGGVAGGAALPVQRAPSPAPSPARAQGGRVAWALLANAVHAGARGGGLPPSGAGALAGGSGAGAAGAGWPGAGAGAEEAQAVKGRVATALEVSHGMSITIHI